MGAHDGPEYARPGRAAWYPYLASVNLLRKWFQVLRVRGVDALADPFLILPAPYSTKRGIVLHTISCMYCATTRNVLPLRAVIVFHLDKLLADRGWTAYRLAQETGLHYAVLAKYQKNQVRRADLKALNAICAVMGCSMGELVEYVPDKAARKVSAKRKR